MWKILNFLYVHVLGRIAYCVWCALIKYKAYKNTNSVHNNGGTLSGSCDLSFPENIYIGQNSYINGGSITASPNAKIVIGENCMISYSVHLRTDMHVYADPSIPMRLQGHTERDIIIQDDVWIGYGAQVMSGVTIAQGCVIAAGAIVTHDTVPYGVYAGVPAKLIKMRTSE